MEKTIKIPEGYVARIEGNKIILEPKESEDERIRKGLIDYFDDFNLSTFAGLDPKKILAWLEKQGSQNLANSAKTCKDEQNPAWSKEDEKTTQRIVDTIMKYAISPHSIINGDKPNLEYAKEFESWLKSLKERCTWKPSDEQLEMLRIVTERSLEDTDKNEREIIGTTLGTLCDDLKKLKR